MTFKNFRPTEVTGSPADKTLSKIAKSIEKYLLDSNSILFTDLDTQSIKNLAIIITEFAEDTYFEIGMWESIEQHNSKLFGNPLPLSKPESIAHSDFPFDEYRISHLLWNVLMILKNVWFSPHHASLLKVSEELSYLLEKSFKYIKGQSTVKKFLALPNKNGTDIKRKLVWVGLKSYLFRDLCKKYLIEKEAVDLDYNNTIPYWDDFICQECTLWSGMGVLDVVANTIKVSESQKNEISSWYERHAAIYKVDEITSSVIKLNNLIINKPYTVYETGNWENFEEGQIIYGSLVPFNGKWYWSGNQSLIPSINEEKLQILIANFSSKNPSIIYRYDKERLGKAKIQLLDYKKYFLEFHGNDFVIFNTGKEVIQANTEKLLYQQRQILGEEKFEEQKAHLEKIHENNFQDPSEGLLNSTDGVCLFFHPLEGDQMTLGFHDFISGLQKEDKALNEKELDAIYAYFQDDIVSPEFIHRIIDHYKTDKTIAKAFYLKKCPSYWLSYILRKHKGKYYRTVYPFLTVLTEEEAALLRRQIS